MERDEKASALARSKGLRLLAEANSLVEADPTQALLLALEGAKLIPGPGSVQARLSASEAPGERAESMDLDRAIVHKVTLASLHALRELRTLFGNEEKINGVEFCPQGEKVLSLSWHAVHVWDASNGSTLFTLKSRGGRFETACFTCDGRMILTARSGRDRDEEKWPYEI